MPLPYVLTVQETAKILRVSTKTLYRLLRDGDLPFVKVRGNIRITSTAINEYLEQGGKPLE